MKTVIFVHGKESGPRGVKIAALGRIATDHGWRNLAPDFRGLDDSGARVEKLLRVADQVTGPLVLVGSSMGGYVSAEVSQRLRPAALLLMAPAVGLPAYPNPDPRPVAGEVRVVHGWRDEIIPPQLAIDWSRRHRVPLQLVDDDHTLRQSLVLLADLFTALLKSADPAARNMAPYLG